MQCDIYKAEKVNDTYLFIPSGEKPEKYLPSNITGKYGRLQFLKTRELDENSPPIAANPKEVIENIGNSGYHIQAVKEDKIASEAGAAIGGGILATSLGFGHVGAVVGAVIGALVAASAKGHRNDSNIYI